MHNCVDPWNYDDDVDDDDGGGDDGEDLDHIDDNCYYLIFAEKASKDIQFPVLVSSVGDSKLFLQPVSSWKQFAKVKIIMAIKIICI